MMSGWLHVQPAVVGIDFPRSARLSHWLGWLSPIILH